MIKDSHPFVQANIFKKNANIGMYIRDKSGGIIQMNKVNNPFEKYFNHMFVLVY